MAVTLKQLVLLATALASTTAPDPAGLMTLMHPTDGIANSEKVGCRALKTVYCAMRPDLLPINVRPPVPPMADRLSNGASVCAVHATPSNLFTVRSPSEPTVRKNASELVIDHDCSASPVGTSGAGVIDRSVQLVNAGGGVTVIVACALIAGTNVLVARITDVPTDTVDTRPLAFTVATAGLLLDHVTAVLAPTSASNVSANCCVAPTGAAGAAGEMVMARTVGDVTVTVAVPETVGFAVLVARTTAVPLLTALTNPVALTVATAGVAELHVTVVAVPASTSTVAVS